jgi:hypothetical protein
LHLPHFLFFENGGEKPAGVGPGWVWTENDGEINYSFVYFVLFVVGWQG